MHESHQSQIPNGAVRQRRNVLDFWYRLAALPELPPTAPFKERELARKMRSSSIALLTITIIFILFLPGCLVFPDHWVLVPEFGVFPICLIAMIINKYRHPILAGALVTFWFEFALMFICLTSWPFDTTDLPLYELFVLGEIMALTLVSPRGMAAVGIWNIIFICLDLIFQPHTKALDQALQVQFAAILVMPTSIQMMIAVVVGWYANNQRKTVQQANRAEMMAQLEHQRLEQSKQSEKEKLALQGYIEQIVAVHAQSINAHRPFKIPLKSYPSLLWPLINAFNSQQARLKNAWETEEELNRLQQAIMRSADLASSGHLNFHQPTGTLLDSLLSALKIPRSR